MALQRIKNFLLRRQENTKSSISPENLFSNFWYIKHNQRRQEHLASLHLEVENKTVLEVGAGIGDHSTFWTDRGADIVITEPREDNRAILKERFPDKDIRSLDLNEKNNKDFEKKFEIVYCYGTLYHLEHPDTAIEFMAKQCSGMLLLSTVVSLGDEPLMNLIDEFSVSATQATSGKGCRPTRSWIENELKKYFPYIYYPIVQPALDEFVLDWDKGNKSTFQRAVFIASRHPIDNKLLVDKMPMKQYRSVHDIPK